MKNRILLAALLAASIGASATTPVLHFTPAQQAANLTTVLKAWYQRGTLVRCNTADLEAARGNCARYADRLRGLPVAEAAWAIQEPDKPAPVAIMASAPWPSMTTVCDRAKLKAAQGACAGYGAVANLPGIWWIIPGPVVKGVAPAPVAKIEGGAVAEVTRKTESTVASIRDWIDAHVGDVDKAAGEKNARIAKHH